MIQARISVVFGNETISVNSVEKRIPLRLPHLLKLKRLDWYGGSQTGLLLFNDNREIEFTEPDIVKPFLERWQFEPPQPDVTQLKRYIDEITLDPNDTADLTARRRWAEIEKRHAKPIYPAALLQLLNTQYAAVDDLKRYRRGEVLSKARAMDKALIRALLNDNSGSWSSRANDSSVTDKESSLRVREKERRRLQNASKKGCV